jgi:ferrous-iron efflux pump FieF
MRAAARTRLEHSARMERGTKRGDHTAALRRQTAAAVSVGTAVGLVILKVSAGVLTGSLSLLASAVDSLTDIFASIVNLYAIRAASRPADREHAYGHGKAEGIAGLFQSAVIGASGLFLGYESVLRLVRPRPVEQEAVGIVVMLISMGASYGLVRYLRRVAEETDSLALAADSTHYATDVLANGGVLAVLVVIRLGGFELLDPLVSLAISLYIVYAAIKVLRESIDHLMDRALPDDVHDRIREIALAHPEILGVHDLRSRSAGSNRFIEIHVEVDGSRTLRDAHDVSVVVLREIEAEIPNSKVFIHTDPVEVPVGIQDPGSRIQ